MKNIICAGMAVLALAGCTAKQPEVEKQRDDIPSKDIAISQIQARLFSRGYTVPFPKSVHHCSESFDIAQVEVIDTAVVNGAAVVKAAAVLTAREDVESGGWVAMNCFGGPWAKGQAANYVEDFTFQKWSSGWVLQR